MCKVGLFHFPGKLCSFRWKSGPSSFDSLSWFRGEITTCKRGLKKWIKLCYNQCSIFCGAHPRPNKDNRAIHATASCGAGHGAFDRCPSRQNPELTHYTAQSQSKDKTSKCLLLIFEIWRCKRVWKSSEKVYSYLEVKQCHKRPFYFDISYFVICPYLPRIELQGKKLHFEILESLGTKTSMTSKPLTLRERFKMTSILLKVAGTTHHKTTVEFVSQIFN